MPVVYESDTSEFTIGTDVPNVPAPPEPGFFTDTLPAMLRRENEIGSLLSYGLPLSGEELRREEPNFDPIQFAIQNGVPQTHWRMFAEIKNTDAAVKRLRQFRQESEDAATIAAAPIEDALVAGLVAGVASPTVLVPGGAVWRSLKTTTILSSALKGTAGAVVGAGSQELLLQSLQERRTLEEGLFNVGAAGVLGGVLGGAAGALSRRAFNDLSSRVADDTEPVSPDPYDAHTILTSPPGESSAGARHFQVGAREAEVTDLLLKRAVREGKVRTEDIPTLTREEIDGIIDPKERDAILLNEVVGFFGGKVGAKFLKHIAFLSPSERITHTTSQLVNETAPRLVNSFLRTKRSDLLGLTSPGVSVENLTFQHTARMDKSAIRINDHYDQYLTSRGTSYLQRKTGLHHHITRTEFRTMATQEALLHGTDQSNTTIRMPDGRIVDVTPDILPFVQKAAQEYRNWQKEFAGLLKNVGLLPKDMPDGDVVGYVSRVPLHERFEGDGSVRFRFFAKAWLREAVADAQLEVGQARADREEALRQIDAIDTLLDEAGVPRITDTQPSERDLSRRMLGRLERQDADLTGDQRIRRLELRDAHNRGGLTDSEFADLRTLYNSVGTNNFTELMRDPLTPEARLAKRVVQAKKTLTTTRAARDEAGRLYSTEARRIKSMLAENIRTEKDLAKRLGSLRRKWATVVGEMPEGFQRTLNTAIDSLDAQIELRDDILSRIDTDRDLIEDLTAEFGEDSQTLVVNLLQEISTNLDRLPTIQQNIKAATESIRTLKTRSKKGKDLMAGIRALDGALVKVDSRVEGLNERLEGLDDTRFLELQSQHDRLALAYRDAKTSSSTTLRTLAKANRKLTGPTIERATYTDAELDDIVRKIEANYRGTPAGRMNLMRIPAERGALKDRTFHVSDTYVVDPQKYPGFPDIRDKSPITIREFMDGDIEGIMRTVNRSLGPDYELARFHSELGYDPDPSLGMGKAGERNYFSDVERDYDTREELLRNDPKLTAKERDKRIASLRKEKARTLEDLGGVVLRLRNLYGLPADPTSGTFRLLNTVLDLSLMSRLGMVLLSSVADAARPVFMHGPVRTFKFGLQPWFQALSDPEMRDGLRALAKEGFGAGIVDLWENSRIMSITEVADDVMARHAIERMIVRTRNGFLRLSGITNWNQSLKQFVGLIQQQTLLDWAEKAATGRLGSIGARNIRRLSTLRLDEDMLTRIWDQYQAHGAERSGVRLPNTEAWMNREAGGDPVAAEHYRSAILLDANQAIVTPGQDKPLLMSRPLGRLLFQFQSFQAATVNRTFIPALQEPSLLFSAGTASMIALGALSFAIKDIIAWDGRHLPEPSDPQFYSKWAERAIDNSGLIPWVFSINFALEQATANKAGFGPWFFGEEERPWAEKGINTLSPGIRYVGDFMNATTGTLGLASDALSGESPTPSEARDTARSIRRITPFNNIFYLRRIYDSGEEALANIVQ